ncbi:MAG: hypothetical protein IJQ65_09335, partial [Kiritimatiellae bacterium]|nr:hypothetical protein [Kiritimatiellia bacterium]
YAKDGVEYYKREATKAVVYYEMTDSGLVAADVKDPAPIYDTAMIGGATYSVYEKDGVDYYFDGYKLYDVSTGDFEEVVGGVETNVVGTLVETLENQTIYLDCGVTALTGRTVSKYKDGGAYYYTVKVEESDTKAILDRIDGVLFRGLALEKYTKDSGTYYYDAENEKLYELSGGRLKEKNAALYINIAGISAGDDVTIELKSPKNSNGVMGLADANGSASNVSAGGDFTLIGETIGTFGTSGNAMEATVGGKTNFKTSRDAAANELGMDAYLDLAANSELRIDDAVSTNGKTMIVTGSDISLTGSGTLSVDGGKLEAKTLKDLTLANLAATDRADVDLAATGTASADSWSFEGSDVDLTVNGDVSVKNLTAENGGSVDVTTHGALDIGTKAEVKGGAVVNLTADGAITNTDNALTNASWTVSDNAELNLITDEAVAIDHLTVAEGASMLVDGHAKDGTGSASYTGKTITVSDSEKASALTIHSVGDITLESDQNSDAKSNVLDVNGVTMELNGEVKPLTKVVFTSAEGGVNSSTDHDGWHISGAQVSMELHDAPQIKDNVLIEGHADVGITAEYGGLTAEDYNGETVAWTVRDSSLNAQ